MNRPMLSLVIGAVMSLGLGMTGCSNEQESREVVRRPPIMQSKAKPKANDDVTLTSSATSGPRGSKASEPRKAPRFARLAK